MFTAAIPYVTLRNRLLCFLFCVRTRGHLHSNVAVLTVAYSQRMWLAGYPEHHGLWSSDLTPDGNERVERAFLFASQRVSNLPRYHM